MANLRANGYLAALAVGSVLFAADQAIVFAHAGAPAGPLALVWPTAFLVLLVLWVVEDSKSYPAIDKPFEYGFLVLMLWLPYLPYYFWRTRRLRGLLLLAGFFALYELGFLAQWAVLAAR